MDAACLRSEKRNFGQFSDHDVSGPDRGVSFQF